MSNPSISKGKRKEIKYLDTEFEQCHQEHVPELEAQIEECDSSNSVDAEMQINEMVVTNPEGIFQYLRERMINEFATFINLDNLPLKFCENDAFEQFVKTSLQPAFEKPPLKELIKTIVATYRDEKRVLRRYFVNFNGGVAVSADLWTSEWGERFICVTCHWIDESWNMQNRILGFRVFNDGATSLGICAKIITVLDVFKLNPKIFRISLGNSLDNNECVDYVTNELKPALRELFTYDRSCAYVTNLCAQHGMEQLELLINPIRDLIKWSRWAYRDYKHVFKTMCKEVGLKPRYFPLDCAKSWNSTYELLSLVFPYREILTKLHKDNVDECLDFQWDCIESIIGLFEKFNDAIHTFSSVYEPSCHLAIQECIHIVHGLRTYENDPFLCLVVRNMKNKWLEHLSDIPAIHCIATILDPRVKLGGLSRLLEYYYETLGVPCCVEEKISEFSAIFERLCAHYESEMVSSKKNKEADHSLRSKLIMQILKKEGTGGQVKSEYDEYLVSGHIIPNPNDFDILKWWKAKVELFPILSKVAKDILCTPSSTVAVESVYSTGEGKGERVLDEQWSMLQPSEIHACICKRDWDLAEKRAQGVHLKQVDEDDPWMMMDTSDSDLELGDMYEKAFYLEELI